MRGLGRLLGAIARRLKGEKLQRAFERNSKAADDLDRLVREVLKP